MTKRMYKSSRNRILTGVCGGIGEYFNIDPTIVRLIFLVLTFAGFSGVLVYIIAALIMPAGQADNFENFEDMKSANPEYRQKPKIKNKIKTDDDFDSYFKK